MAVTDRVKHHGINGALIGGFRCLVDQGCNSAGYTGGECDFDKDQWIVWHRWVEKRKAHAVVT